MSMIDFEASNAKCGYIAENYSLYGNQMEPMDLKDEVVEDDEFNSDSANVDISCFSEQTLEELDRDIFPLSCSIRNF